MPPNPGKRMRNLVGRDANNVYPKRNEEVVHLLFVGSPPQVVIRRGHSLKVAKRAECDLP